MLESGVSLLDFHFLVHLLSNGLLETNAVDTVTTRMGQRRTIPAPGSATQQLFSYYSQRLPA